MQSDIIAYHAGLSAEDRRTCEQLAEIIARALPEANGRVWHAHPVWFLDGNPVVGYSKLKVAVRVLFWSGQSFETSGLRASGKFKAAEVRYAAAEDIDEVALSRWLAESREVQWDYKNIVRRRGELLRLR